MAYKVENDKDKSLVIFTLMTDWTLQEYGQGAQQTVEMLKSTEAKHLFVVVEDDIPAGNIMSAANRSWELLKRLNAVEKIVIIGQLNPFVKALVNLMTKLHKVLEKKIQVVQDMKIAYQIIEAPSASSTSNS